MCYSLIGALRFINYVLSSALEEKAMVSQNDWE